MQSGAIPAPAPDFIRATTTLQPGSRVDHASSIHLGCQVVDENLVARYQVEEISAQTLDADFARNPKIHRAWRFTAR